MVDIKDHILVRCLQKVHCFVSEQGSIILHVIVSVDLVIQSNFGSEVLSIVMKEYPSNEFICNLASINICNVQCVGKHNRIRECSIAP